MKARSSRNSKVKKIFYVTATALFVLVIGLLLPRLFNFVGSVVMTPVHAVSQWYETSEQAVPTLLREKNTLNEEIKDLENQLTLAKGVDLTLRLLRDENSRLRTLLGAQEVKRTAANVIARPSDIPYDFLQIDRGRNAGIQENALVYVGRDQLIGVVSHVNSDYSFVELFTKPGIELTGFISGPDVVATVEGVGGGVARVKVPQGISLTVGDLVYVPSVQPGLFGQIDFIENRPSQPEQFGYITLQTSIQSLHEVAVADRSIEVATVESIEFGKASIIRERLLVEEAHTISFEELKATTTGTTTEDTAE